MREVFAEIRSGGARGKELQEAAKSIRIGWSTDAASLERHLATDTGKLQDRRLRILVAQIREMLDDPLVTLRWADTQVMLADSLTKLSVERAYLLEAMRTGCWSPASTPESLQKKVMLRAQRQARKLRAEQKENIPSTPKAEDGLSI